MALGDRQKPYFPIGFWTDKGHCNQEITDFLKTVQSKEVFLFGTAGFGGSQEYFGKILSSVQKHLDASNTVIGTYMCQGKMPQSVRERYVKMKNSPLPISGRISKTAMAKAMAAKYGTRSSHSPSAISPKVMSMMHR